MAKFINVLMQDARSKINAKNTALLLPVIFSFFYLFARGISISSMYVACLIGLLIVIFSNESEGDNKLVCGWCKVIALMVAILSLSLLFYFFSGVSQSYLDSSFSIVLTIIPFLFFIKKLDKEELLIFSLILLFIGSSILSYWLGEQSEYGARMITSRYFKLLYFAPLLLMFKWMGIKWNTFLVISSLGIIGALVVVLITFFNFGLADSILVDEFLFKHQAAGNTNPIFFGLISLSLTAYILIAINLDLLKRNYKYVLALVFSLGLMCVLASKSRGVWLALVVVLFLSLIFYLANKKITSKRKLSATIIMLLASLIIYNIPVVKDRVTLSFSNFEAYKNTETTVDVDYTNSLGARLELWKAAFSIFTENITLGVGPGGFNSKLNRLSQESKLNPYFASYNQAHSQYFHTLATKGLIGIIVLLIFYVGLIWIPLKRLLLFDFNAEKYTKYLATCSIAIVVCYAILSLTESPFERRSAIVFFIYFYTLSFAAMKYSEVKAINSY